jgi:hypothetical protein
MEKYIQMKEKSNTFVRGQKCMRLMHFPNTNTHTMLSDKPCEFKLLHTCAGMMGVAK